MPILHVDTCVVRPRKRSTFEKSFTNERCSAVRDENVTKAVAFLINHERGEQARFFAAIKLKIRLCCRPMSEVTRLLQNIAAGDAHSLNRLYELVYAELRAIAVQKMASERAGHTLQPTALIHEAYLRLGGGSGLSFENRAHFFASASEAMRRILVDNARRNQQLKRGGKQERVELETRIAAPMEDEKLLQVNEALDLLAREDPVKAEVVKMRYFIGLQHQEIADALGVSEPTVRRHWAVARVRLFELIAQKPSTPPAPASSRRSDPPA